jgi:hypothetical protein
MIRYALRFFAENIEKKIVDHQVSIANRLKKEIEKQPYVVDPEDKGSPLGEYGYRIKGPEPTRYGDWERKGRVSDF